MDNSEKPLLVMIHGWGFDSGVFTSLVELLKKRFRIQLINLPGYADQKYISECSLTRLVRFVQDEVSEPANYIGWSMGGLIALELAATQPKKVNSLIMLASTPCFAKKESWPEAMDRSILEKFIVSYNKEPDLTLGKFSYLVSEGNKNPRHWIRELKTLSISKVAPAALEQGLKILLDTDLRERLKGLTTPTLMILGEKDMLVPLGVTRQINLLNKKIKIEIISDSGHTPFLTHTDQVAEAVYEHTAG